MSTYARPYAIQCAELAARRESAKLRIRLKGRVTDLATIAATAPLIGFFGTVLSMLTSSQTYGTSKSVILAHESGRSSEALIPAAMGLLIALIAFWSYRYLCDQLEMFELEMENTTVDLVNRLIVYVEALRHSDPPLWAALRRKPGRSEAKIRAENDVEPPRLTIGRVYRNGLLEMISPHLEVESDKEVLFDSAALFCFGYAAIGGLAYWFQNRPLSGLIVFSFVVLAGLLIERQAMQGIIYMFAFLANAAVFWLFSPYGAGAFAFCGLAAALPLWGLLRTGQTGGMAKQSSTVKAVQALPLPLLFAGACTVLLFGTFWGLYKVRPEDSSMCPTMRPGDWLAGTLLPASEPIYRTELLEVNAGVLGTVRVVGLPGDRIQIKVGQLVLNGVPIREPYITPYKGEDGDFPLPSTAVLDDGYFRWKHASAYPQNLHAGEPYLVPEGRYFVLNDDRKQLGDSRTLGPLRHGNAIAKVIVAFPAGRFLFGPPRLLH